MYESFYGLRERPFDLTPNPRFLLLTPTHREALSNLQYGITGRKGVTLLIGDAGTGKTTLVRTVLQQCQADGHLIGYISNPTLKRDEFVELIADVFELSPAARTSKARMLQELTDLALSRHQRGLITGLLIDEAQSLSHELLEEVRLLANIETTSEKVFQVVLAGQPEIASRLNGLDLRQLKQRIALRCLLSPLDVREVAAYIAGRIHIAGGISGQLFTREAVMAIHEHSRGVPRVISVICDNVLLSGFAANRRPVTRDLVEDVCRDFDLEGMEGSDPVPAAPPVVVPEKSAAKVASSPHQDDSLLETLDLDAPPSSTIAPLQDEADRIEPQPMFGSVPRKRRFSFF